MNRRRHHPQLFAGKHHYHVIDPRKGCKIFGVAGVGKVGPILKGFLMDRRCCQGAGIAAAHQIYAAGNHVDHTLCIVGLGDARSYVFSKRMYKDG